MDSQKKQKVLLAGLAIAALGAGYFVFFRDSGSRAQDFMRTGPVERKKVDRSAESKSTRKERPKGAADRAAPATVERKERAEQDNTTVERKKRRIEKKEEKKKTVAPAA